MNIYGEVEVRLHAFKTSIVRNKKSVSRPRRFNPMERALLDIEQENEWNQGRSGGRGGME
jgi:hypothetical protein